MFRFGICPTVMRVFSFMDLISTTDTEFEVALATYEPVRREGHPIRCQSRMVKVEGVERRHIFPGP